MWQHFRDLTLGLGGLGLCVHEALLTVPANPALLCLGAAMLGLPAFFRTGEKEEEKPSARVQRRVDTSAMRWDGRQWRLNGEPIKEPKEPRKSRAQRRIEKEEQEKTRRRALVLTDLRVIDRAEYRKHEHPADKEVREGLEYLGLNK